MSIAGGLPRAVARAVLHGCESLQIFTRSTGRWQARAFSPEEVAAFRHEAAAAGLFPIVSHASYLINVASADLVLCRRSLGALGDELDRAERLGLFGVVLHPGTGPEAAGLPRIAEAVATLLADGPADRARVLLEHTAGQGASLGWRFEHLARIIELAGGAPRIGVCLDTCHLLAAGYDLTTESGYRQTFDDFARIVGLGRLCLFHLNDSKRPPGSRVDRHEHIGRGYVGLPAFRRLLGDSRFAGLPMIIETAKSPGREGPRVQLDPLDEMNLATLRRLFASPAAERRTSRP